ncbi:MAG: type II toxin-antitoxin system RelE/ParE family toxin [Dehalococcoidia bacterium]
MFSGRDSRAARRLPHDIWPVIRRKLDMIGAAQAVGDLGAPPGNRLEALKGDRAGRYSIRVNDQFRITFRFGNGKAYDVTSEDYQGRGSNANPSNHPL